MVDVWRGLRAPILVAAAACVATPPALAAESIRLVERATNEHVIDLGAHGDSLGDLLVFANPLHDATNGKALGTSNGSCVRTVVGQRWQCAWTMTLAGGQLQVGGECPDEGDADFAITGGTGRYAGARGTLRVHARDAGHASYDFTVSLL
jgi:hypothetical protein